MYSTLAFAFGQEACLFGEKRAARSHHHGTLDYLIQADYYLILTSRMSNWGRYIMCKYRHTLVDSNHLNPIQRTLWIRVCFLNWATWFFLTTKVLQKYAGLIWFNIDAKPFHPQPNPSAIRDCHYSKMKKQTKLHTHDSEERKEIHPTPVCKVVAHLQEVQ